MKRILILLAAVWLMLGFAGLCEAKADETTVMYVHVRDGTYLNARHDPAKDSAVEMRLHRGNVVTVLSVDGNWAQIEGSEAGTAWCCTDYLAIYPPDEDAHMYTVVSNGRVRVRRSPVGETVRYLQDGNSVGVRFVIDGWACLDDGGYVMAEYLTVEE